MPALFVAGVVHGAPPDFSRDIRPILSDRCFTCHGPDDATRTTALRFDQEESAFAKLSNGRYAIVRGKPEASELIRRVKTDDPAKRMPPQYMGHAALKPDEIEKLEAWVRAGAPWQSHWAFATPVRPAEPAVENTGWVRNPIDSFVLARLEEEAFKPSPEADRATLIRRVSFDLTGLPPTPAEVDAFLNDSSANAYEKVVDRLLASPGYGERMAFRWLDAARYADTNGYQNDQERYMWRWRDWVIEAFNSNMPFDRFTIEQLAGDLLPNPTLEQLIATGFNRNHRGNAENGTDPDEYQVEYAVDRVETTATVWLGLTMGCARCHDHKYDPISQKEFYRFYAYFNNVSDRGRYFKYGNTPPIIRAPTRGQRAELAALESRIEESNERLDALESSIEKEFAKWSKRAAQNEFDWTFDERLAVREAFDGFGTAVPGKVGQAARLDGEDVIDLGNKADFDFYSKFTLSAWIRPESSTGGIISRHQPTPRGYGLFLVDGKLQLRIDTASISDRVRVETVASVPLNEWTHVAAAYDGSRLARGMTLYINGEAQELHVLIDESLNNTRAAKDTPLRVGHGPGEKDRFVGLIDDVRIYDRPLSAEQVGVVSVADSLREIAHVPDAERTASQAQKLRWAFLSKFAPARIKDLWNELALLRLERETLLDRFPTVMVMDEREDVRPTHVLYRGSFDAPREQVRPGLPAVLPPGPPGIENDRLRLARWLTDPTHPLTSRVTVNRFWQMLFGRGIVSTVEDFGSQGAEPTHPKLLDWLAVEFIENGWNIKQLLKTIVMSATYRQSSRATPALLERDPENLLLARAPRVRLPAEAIRDQALAVSGLLHEGLGGPSVKPYQPAGLWKELSNWGAYENDHGDELYRRSLYTFWKRTLGPPSMLAFDSAARETCVVREVRTNTPIQALNLMNDVTYAEAARLLAERMIREGGDSDGERLMFGFRLATARPPEPKEKDILMTGLRRFQSRYQSAPADAEAFLDHGEHPRDASIDAPELAAYTAIASLILNLDETVTKN